MNTDKANIDSFVERWCRLWGEIKEDFSYIIYCNNIVNCKYKMHDKNKACIIQGDLLYYTFFYNTVYDY